MTKKRKRRKTRTIPILPLVGVGAGLIEPIKRARDGDWEGAFKETVQTVTGVDTDTGEFHADWLQKFWVPVILGTLGHKAANALGINRIFARLPSPLNKLRL